MLNRAVVAVIVVAMLCLGGCAKDMAFRKDQALPPGESIVCGQVIVLMRGVPVKWGDGGLLHGSGTLWGRGFFKVSVVPEDDVKPVYQDLLTQDGVFAWRLAPGLYRMVGYEWEFSSYPMQYRASGRFGATFSVPPAGQKAYIGTITVDLEAKEDKDRLKLTQNAAPAADLLRQRGAAGPDEVPTTALMNLEVPR